MNSLQRWTTVVTVAAIASTPSVTHGQIARVASAPAPGKYASVVQQGRALIDSVMMERNIPGLSVAVSVDGEIVWSEGFGYSNIEQQTPVTTTTKFRIGSISKSLTAAALAQLYESGKLDLDAPVQQYVSSFPEKAKGTVTTRLLAGHLAGVRHYAGQEFLSGKRYSTVTESLDIFKNDTLQTPPGDKYSYSSYGWNLLSAVVERASDQRFLAYMHENVFRPLGMRHTVADHTDSIIFGRTGFYVRNDDRQIVNAPYVDNSYKWAGGGFLSTPEDLLRFAYAHMTPGFLKPETVELMWTSQKTTAGEETDYGIGWSTGDRNSRRFVGHGGGSVGGSCSLFILRDDGVAVALTTNISSAGFSGVPRIAAMFAAVP